MLLIINIFRSVCERAKNRELDAWTATSAQQENTVSSIMKTQIIRVNMSTVGLLFTVMPGNRTSTSLFSGFVDDEHVE